MLEGSLRAIGELSWECELSLDTSKKVYVVALCRPRVPLKGYCPAVYAP